MNNVEGNYDEIVRYIDETDMFSSVGFATVQGSMAFDEDGNKVLLNAFGLLSLYDNMSVGDPQHCRFDRTSVYCGEADIEIPVDDPDNSHLIRF